MPYRDTLGVTGDRNYASKKPLEVKIIDEMKPLKDYLQGKSSTIEFIEDCREIRETKDAEFENL